MLLLEDVQFKYREVQGHETEKFLSYFKPCIIPQEGGAASGFKHPVAEEHQTQLFVCKGKHVDHVKEIVRNVGDAPLLVDIYSEKGTTRTRIEKEKAKDSWPLIRRRWKEESCVPDGLILVEQLKDEDDEIVDESGSRSWGIVIQGRGLDCSACYILKTNRVRSTVGFCTYFCLVRAKCFGETAALQLRNSWLL